jgi:hypothetical protein
MSLKVGGKQKHRTDKILSSLTNSSTMDSSANWNLTSVIKFIYIDTEKEII